MTHEERRERRRQIAAMVRDGGSVADTARRFGICPGTVGNACEEHGVECRTRRQASRERRARIAEAVKSGASRAEAATRFGVCLDTARLACKEHGVTWPPLLERPRRIRDAPVKRILGIVARLLAGRKQAGIAREFKCSRQRVGQIRDIARAAGIKV